ncbi:MAG: penicillin-binding protein 2 [Bdellovibrionaceae bacterium]|nr:penicillin-binding protein 2 [Pseudobdellovibrionaceae bacterium]
MKTRIIIIFLCFALVWCLVLSRALYIQVLPNQKLTHLQEKKYQTRIKLNSQRGSFLDKDRREIAMSQISYSVYADPKLIKSPKATARQLSKHLGVGYETIYMKIKDRNRRFVWLQRFIDEAKLTRIQSSELAGISYVQEWKRIYPFENLYKGIVGIVGQEGNGLEGLELRYDKWISGDNGKVNVKRDARGRPLNIDGMIVTENQMGNDLVMTIDTDLQFYFETQMKETLAKFDGEGAIGIVLDATTSEIRSMVSLESQRRRDYFVKQKAITDVFEPGSTLKPFVMALGLEENLIMPNSKIFCENGKMKVADRWIKESDQHHQFGYLSPSEILAFSSNIGIAKIGFQLGTDRLRDGLIRFGIGQKTQVDFPGESKGVLHETPWNSHLLANISFGQGLSVNALQLTNSFAALVNGGLLNRPLLVKGRRNAETLEYTELERAEPTRVISKKTSDLLKVMLSSVTHEGGTGVNARVPGFLIGGKTGTAQKASLKFRGYEPNAYLSSFIGFIPVHEPKYVIYVMIDTPKKSFYGSQVAAPVFAKVASFLARKDGMVPNVISDKNLVAGFEKNVRPSAKGKKDETSAVAESKILSLRDLLKTPHLHDDIEFIGKGSKVDFMAEEEQVETNTKKVRVYLKSN